MELGAFAEQVQERIDAYGSTVKTRLPYLCDCVQWSTQCGMVVETVNGKFIPQN